MECSAASGASPARWRSRSQPFGDAGSRKGAQVREQDSKGGFRKRRESAEVASPRLERKRGGRRGKEMARKVQPKEGRKDRMAKVGADPTIPVIASTSCRSMPCSSSQFSDVIHDLILGSVSSSFGSLVSDFCESQGESTARGNRLR